MSSGISIIIICISLTYISASHVEIIESDEFKLPRNVIPNYYDLHLIPNMHKGTFEGSLNIEIIILKSALEISIHCKNLKLIINKTSGIRLRALESDRKSSKGDKYGISGYNFTASHYSQSSNIIRIVFSNPFEAGEYTLHFDKFHGSLENDNLEGFHFGEYENKDGDYDQFAVTQFGPSKARNAFPCFDEPFFRAKYKICITIPKQYNCVSPYAINSSREISKTDDKMVTVVFEYPVPLPTYSVGFFISKLKSESISKFPISHVVADCPKVELDTQRNYSIGVAEQIIIKMGKYLRVDFPLKVLYHIAIPDDWMYFESMGSWGFNTFRETELLYSKKILDKMLITISVAHKIAQQWFGNSISPDFWTWGWFTEGLATFVSYKIVDQVHPDWLVTDLLIIETYNSMNIDFDCCIKGLSYEPKTPLEISFKYSNTAAYKGAAILRMIEEMLPKGMFIQGLARFVQEKELSTVKSKDLYNGIEKFIKMRPHLVKIPLTLSQIIFNWEENTGYPIIEVTRNSHNEEEITVTQKSYGDKNSKSVWCIPINYSIKKPKSFSVQPTDWLITETKEMTIKFLMRDSWILLNNKGFYYYRVKYDARNWFLIEQQLLEDHEEIHYLNRMQLISDSFSLADNGWIEYYVPLDLIKYIQHETRYAPLKALKDASDTLNNRLCGTYIKQTFNDVITNALKIIIDNLHKQAFREDLMVLDFVSFWLCELEPDQCNKHGKNTPNSGNFEKNIWCRFIQTDANENQWNELFKDYQSSSFDPDKFAALACAEDSRLLIKFLNYVMSNDKHRLVTAIKSTISNNEDFGANVALKFIISHFKELLQILSDQELADIFADVGAKLATAEDLLPLTKFAKTHSSYHYLTEPSIRKARENVKWRESNLEAVEKYFSDYKPSGSARQISFNVVTLFLNHMLFKNFISKLFFK